ncbi:MAG: hypothetical protein N2Z80_02140 [Hydrogenothermaceae bacterium]|nr:hypothetical protein [Hydrogenothermaceae bacterium]
MLNQKKASLRYKVLYTFISVLFGILIFLNFALDKFNEKISQEIVNLENKQREVLVLKKVLKNTTLDFSPKSAEDVKMDMLDEIDKLSKRFMINVVEDFNLENQKVLTVKLSLKSDRLKKEDLASFLNLLNREDIFFLVDKLSIEKGGNGSTFDALIKIKGIVK